MINKCRSNPNNCVRVSSRVNRNSSQLAIKKSEISSRLGTPREDNELSKIRRTSFWMKKVVGGGYANENNPKKTKQASRKVLSMKVKTQSSEVEDDQKQNKMKDLNSKFQLILKYQEEIMEEVRLVGDDKIVKQNYCEKISSLLSRVIKMLQKNELMDRLPSLYKILENQIEGMNILFTKTREYVNNFIEKTKSNDLIVKNVQLEKENNKILTKFHFLEDDIKRIRASKIQIIKEEDRPAINIRKIDFEELYSYICRNNEPKSISIEATNRVCEKIMENSFKNKNLKVEEIYNQTVSHLLTSEGLSALKKLLDFQNIKNKSLSFNNEHQLRTQSLVQLFTIDVISGKVNLNWLKGSVKGTNLMKRRLKIQDKAMSVSEFILLLNKFTIINSGQKKLEILGFLFGGVREVKNEKSVEKQLMQMLREREANWLQFDENKENQKKMNKINKMKNKRLINCLSLFQGKENNEKMQSQTFEVKTKQNEKIQLNQIDCILCLYFYLKEQFTWLKKVVLTNIILYEKDFNFKSLKEIFDKKIEEEAKEEYEKNENQINSIINLYRVLRKNKKGFLLEQDIREQMVEDVVNSSQEEIVERKLSKICA